MSVKPKTNLILDTLILVMFILAVFSGFHLDATLDSASVQPGQATGLILQLSNVHPAIHWHGLTSMTFVVLIVVHHIVHWKWMRSQIRPLLRNFGQRSRVLEN
jgi:hypothetical protein